MRCDKVILSTGGRRGEEEVRRGFGEVVYEQCKHPKMIMATTMTQTCLEL